MLVRAKRLGWDHTLDVGRFDDFDPFDREDIEVVGELTSFEVTGSTVQRYRQYLVNGQVVDPKTIEPENVTAALSEIVELHRGSESATMSGDHSQGDDVGAVRGAEGRGLSAG